jgi:hypothetical protein
VNFFTKAILGSVAVLVAAAAVVLFFRSREAARVEALIREAARWAAEGKAEPVAALVDDEFDGDAEVAKSEIRRRVRPGAFEKLEIADIEVGVDGDEARVRVVVRVQSSDLPYPVPQELLLTLRKREAGWRLVSAGRPEDRLRR